MSDTKTEANKVFELLCPINNLNKDNPIRLSNGDTVYRDSKTNTAWQFFLKGWCNYSKYIADGGNL